MNNKTMNSLFWLCESDVGDLALSFIKGILILIGGWLAARFLSKCSSTAIERANGKKDILLFVNRFVFYGVIALSSVAALSEIGIDTNSFLAVLGGAALAIGLGLKDQLGQLTAGIVLLIKRPFGIGDFITIAGQTGKVESIDFFQTILKTPDSKKVVLPNNIATSGVITNYSGYSTRRIEIPITISYKDSIESAKKALLDVAKDHALVLDEPSSQAVMLNMKDYGVELCLRCWVSSPNYGKTRAILLENVKEKIEKEGYTIPYPQLVIHNLYEAK